MASAPPAARPRPISPHLTHWRWGIHMVVSILHRVTGHAMALGAVPILCWWLVALASGERAYGSFYRTMSGWFGYLLAVGFTWVVLQHMANGVRHLVMDSGAGFEIGTNKRSATSTLVFSLVMTLVLWGAVSVSRGGF